MNYLTDNQKKSLEAERGKEICPLTLVESDIDRQSHEEKITACYCSVNFEHALEGPFATGSIGNTDYKVALEPCSRDFAERCPLYNKHEG
tara:strand:- start:1485 stop:1754 length:270 start_codon:yes stop_codon:yes gene_type:complete